MSNIGAFNFTIEDVRKQLNILGYSSIPDDKLSEFAEDLRKLIEYDQKRVNNDSFTSQSQSDTSVIQAVSDDNGGRHSVPCAGNASQQRSRKVNRMKRILASRKSPVGLNSSMEESNTSDVDSSGLNHKFDDLHLYQRGLSAVSECRRPTNYYKPPSSARPDLYPQRPLHDESKSFAPHLPRSFIRPSTVAASSATAGRGLPKSSSRKVDINGMTQEKRTDPVKKFNAYNQAWKQTKPPGEKNRNQLRWKIREQMAVSEEITKKRPSLKPSTNRYVVPTDKKRQDLRWEVRCNLAAFKPGSKNTQFY